nr:phosphatidylglycerol lysyltransferase domain-containing protein [Kofleriaceae bacterium]
MTAIADDAHALRDDVVRYGHDTVAFQGLGPGFETWRGEAGAAAYVDTGGAWVVAGSPLAPADRLADAAAELTAAASSAGRRASFFAAEQPLVDAGLRALVVGEQPVWQTAGWGDVLASSSSLRYQLARARRKGVTVRAATRAELVPGSPMRDAIASLGTRWQEAHRMPPMQFLVQLAPLAELGDRFVMVAEQAGALVGFGSAVPVPARSRAFLEHFVRAPDAPNGTVELVVDAVMRAQLATEITLGLAPLAGQVSRWLRLARWAGSALYGFAGLRAFKAKLRPHTWEPVYLCTCGQSTVVALRDALRAFAGGSLAAFAGRTLVR